MINVSWVGYNFFSGSVLRNQCKTVHTRPSQCPKQVRIILMAPAKCNLPVCGHNFHLLIHRSNVKPQTKRTHPGPPASQKPPSATVRLCPKGKNSARGLRTWSASLTVKAGPKAIRRVLGSGFRPLFKRIGGQLLSAASSPGDHQKPDSRRRARTG